MACAAPAVPIDAQRLVAAAYRPCADEIALFVEHGDVHGTCILTVSEARAIHGVLGQALRLAECRADPTSAVPA